MKQVRSLKPIHPLRFGVILIITLISFMDSMMAQKYPSPPEGSNFVIDFAGVLSVDEKDALDVKIMGYYDTTSVAVVVVITKETGGTEIDDYANGMAREWGLGVINKEKAILLLIKSDTPRQITAVTANFSDGADPGAYINDMLRQEIARLIKKGKFYPALSKGTDLIFNILSGNVNTISEDTEDPSRDGNPVTIILAALVLILAVRRVAHYRRCRR